jgi:hypothetical protein
MIALPFIPVDSVRKRLLNRICQGWQYLAIHLSAVPQSKGWQSALRGQGNRAKHTFS